MRRYTVAKLFMTEDIVDGKCALAKGLMLDIIWQKMLYTVFIHFGHAKLCSEISHGHMLKDHSWRC